VKSRAGLVADQFDALLAPFVPALPLEAPPVPPTPGVSVVPVSVTACVLGDLKIA
jgi:hypothetical protein